MIEPDDNLLMLRFSFYHSFFLSSFLHFLSPGSLYTSSHATDVSDFSEYFEVVESKDDPRAKLLRIKPDSGLKNENVFLVESKWPTQRLVLQGKYPLRLIMITQKHAKWMLGV